MYKGCTILGFLLLLAGCGGAFATPPESAEVKKQKGPVIVAIVIDQFGAWIAKNRLDLLPIDGGFARLRREGTYFKELEYPYAITETAPGHASLFTGLVPHEHGIVANEVPAPDGNGKLSIIADASKKKITVNGPIEGAGASLAALLKPVAADHFRERFGRDGYAAGISMKDRGAVFGAGKSGDLVLWFDPGLQTFVTSDAWSARIPESLRTLIEPKAVALLEEEPWIPLDVDWLDKHASKPSAPGEGDLGGFGTAFPHVASRAKKPGLAFRTEPRSDQLLLELGLKILDDEVQGRPVFLAISLSANDYIGHVFGPDSEEAWDELRRLDASLGRFFEELDKRFGPKGWSVVLSADHGVVSLPEKTDLPDCGKDPIQSREPCGNGYRIEAAAVKEKARVAARTVLKNDNAIAAVVDPYIYLAPTSRSLDAKTRKKLLLELNRELKKLPGVQEVFDVNAFEGPCPEPPVESLASLVCRSVHAGVGGEFYLVTTPGSFFDPEIEFINGEGTSHGSPYGYDRFVPMFVRDAAEKGQGGKVVEEARPFSLYHDTLIRMIDR
jgi:predicted AlkP superfamily pyrophosphatase or phosphodiesterase